ncbi:MAG: creatininase family protein [Myxococcales bacterium]|nr:creatininase family protein [Myxococcales bacterium]
MGTEPIRLLDLPHAEARRLLATGAPVYLPVNPVEYHGPHLSLHNDRLVSHGLIDGLHPRVAPEHPLLLADDLEIGVDPCCGPGTRYTALSVARRTVREACKGLAELGAKRVVLMTFHGSPLHNLALEAGVKLLQRRGVVALSPFNLVLQRMLTLRGEEFAEAAASLPDAADRAAVTEGLPVDLHAGFFETSVALAVAPATVHPGYRALAPCPEVRPNGFFRVVSRIFGALGARDLARELSFISWGLGWYGQRPFPGYTGRPHLANAEAGAWFLNRMLDEATPVVRAALWEGAPGPAPILPWLAWLTLGGRVGGIRVPADRFITLPAELDA